MPRSGLAIEWTVTPAEWRMPTTSFHPELSAKAPWTRATWGLVSLLALVMVVTAPVVGQLVGQWWVAAAASCTPVRAPCCSVPQGSVGVQRAAQDSDGLRHRSLGGVGRPERVEADEVVDGGLVANGDDGDAG